MSLFRLGVISIFLSMFIGCAGGTLYPYTEIPLDRDLSPQTLERYQKETAATNERATGAEHMITIENTDWRILGLLAWWKKGTVQVMNGNYMISRSESMGPLAMLYATGETAMFNREGKRQSYSSMTSFLWGHVAMSHAMGVALDNGDWMGHESIALLHHLLNVGESHAGDTISLFSSPNPVGN